jgi:excisionase family DNA binding protein
MPEPLLLAEPLLDANEAARLLKVPRSTLYELVRSRNLPHVKVGRALRFTRADPRYLDRGQQLWPRRYAASGWMKPIRAPNGSARAESVA